MKLVPPNPTKSHESHNLNATFSAAHAIDYTPGPHRTADADASRFRFTDHALERIAERKVPLAIVEAVASAGAKVFDHQGGLRRHLHDKSAFKRFTKLLGGSRQDAERYANIYVVTATDTPELVITVAYRDVSSRTKEDLTPLHRQYALAARYRKRDSNIKMAA